MDDEYDALMKNNCWTLVPKPIDKKIIGCKWIFKLKNKNSNGYAPHYKLI